MKSELGSDLVEGTGVLRIDPTQCWSDVAAFDAAIAEHRDAEAVALYTGSFLDGFHLSDSSEFSEWADGERDRRAATARAAAVRAAESGAGDDRAGTVAWQRAVALDPLNSRLVLRLVDALAAQDDRTGAIRAAEQYATRVRVDLDAEPDAAVVRRADALRAGSFDGSPAAVGPGSRGGAPGGPRHSLAATDPTVATSTVTATAVTSRVDRRAIGVGALAVGILLAGLAWTNRAPAPLRDGEFVLLAEFTNLTTDSLLSRTVGTAVAAALQQSAHVVPLPRGRVSAALRRMERLDTTERLDLEVARDVAQREGVRLVLAGEVVEAGSERELISRIIEASTGRILAARRFRVTSNDGLLSAIDRLAATMRRDLGEASATVAEALPLPDVTTGSLAALHFYAEGLDADRRGNTDLAAELFDRAVALDSNFASAHARLGTFHSANNNVPRSTFHFARALAQVDRLPLDEALRIRIAAAYARGDLDEAVNLSEGYLGSRPRDAGAWARLAFYLFASGQGPASRAAYAVADSLSPLSATNILNIGTSWSMEAKLVTDTVMFDSARVQYERAIAMQPSMEYNVYYNQQYGEILLGAGRPDSARATFQRMMQRGPLDRARGLRSLAFLDALEGNWRKASAGFAQAAELSVQRRQWTSALRNDALQADLLLTIGEAAGAAAPLRRATTIALREPIETRAVAFVALANVKAGDRRTASRLLDRMRSMSRPEHGGEQAAILSVEGALALATGRAKDALTALRAASVRDSTSPQMNMLHARALSAVGDDSTAAVMWERVSREFAFGVEGQFDWQFAAYEQGRTLERLGRVESAMAAYRRLVSAFPVGVATFETTTLIDARARLRHFETSR